MFGVFNNSRTISVFSVSIATVNAVISSEND